MQFKSNIKNIPIDQNDFKAYSNVLAAEKRLRYSGTRIAEEFAQQYLLNPTPKRAYQFCRYVFKIWASQSGNRVFGNIEKKNTNFSHQLHKRLQKITSLIERAGRHFEMRCVEQLNEIDGLGTSYSSKLLRILYPEKFATLDSILRNELGYRDDSESYQAFIDELHRFKQKYKLTKLISEIEVVLFVILSSKSKNKVLEQEYKCFNHDFI